MNTTLSWNELLKNNPSKAKLSSILCNLHRLTLDNAKIRREDLFLFLEGAQDCSLPLRHLSLKNGRLSNEMASLISLILHCCKQLESLDLSGNHFKDSGIQELCQALKGSSIQHLDFSQNPIGPNGIQQVADLLIPNATGMSSVTTLCLRDTFLTHFNGMQWNGLIALCQALRPTRIPLVEASNLHPFSDYQNLTSLDLGKNRLNGNSICILANSLRCNPTLTQLNLEDNVIGTKGAFWLTFLLLRNPRQCCLRQLNLARCKLGAQGILAMTKALQPESLNGIEALALTTGETLNNLPFLNDLDNRNNMDNIEESNKNDNRNKNQKRYEEMDLNKIQESHEDRDLNKNVSFPQSYQVCRDLPLNSKVQFRKLPEMDAEILGCIDQEDVVHAVASMNPWLAIFQPEYGVVWIRQYFNGKKLLELSTPCSLPFDQGLTDLILNSNEIGVEGSQAVALLLKCLGKNLQKVHLNDNNLTTEGTRLILNEGLTAASSLISLNLVRNNINEITDLRNFVGFSPKNLHHCALQSLDISYNCLGARGVDYLCSELASDAFKNNNSCTLERLHLQHNMIGEIGLCALDQMLKINTSILELKISKSDIEGTGNGEVLACQTKGKTLLRTLPLLSGCKIAFLQGKLVFPYMTEISTDVCNIIFSFCRERVERNVILE